MLPYRERSPDSTTAGDGAADSRDVSASTAAREKPSLRILDAGPATREEDLARGPLIYSLGGGTNIGRYEYGTTDSPPKMDPELDLGGSDWSENGREFRLHLGPLELHPAESLPTMSQSESSGRGRAFSSATDGTSTTEYSQNHQKMNSCAQNIDRISHDSAALPLPWRYEFAWKKSQLLFANEPFYVGETAEIRFSGPGSNSAAASTTTHGSQTQLLHGHESHQLNSSRSGGTWQLDTNPNSKTVSPTSCPISPAHLTEDRERIHSFLSVSLSGVGGSMEFQAAGDIESALQIPLAGGSVDQDTSLPDIYEETDPGEEVREPTLAFIAREETTEWLVQLLKDWYFRSCPRQGQGKRTQAPSIQNAHRPGTENGKVGKTQYRPIRPAGGERGRKLVDGNGDSEDEDSASNKRGSSGSTRSKGPRIACPFLRWNPCLYTTTCMVQLKTGSHVKDHIRTVHVKPYCPTCYMIYGEIPQDSHTNCVPSARTPPVDLITDDKLEAMETTIKGENKIPERWKNLYKLLLPGEKVVFKPFLSAHEIKAIEKLKRLKRNKSARSYLDQCLIGSGYRGNESLVIIDNVFTRFFPHMLSQGTSQDYEPYPSNGIRKLESGDALPEIVYQRVDMDFAAVNSYSFQDTGSDRLQEPFDSTADTVLYSGLGFQNQSMLVQTAPDGQKQSESFDRWYPQITIGAGDTGATGLVTSHWDASNEYVGNLPGFEFFDCDEEFLNFDKVEGSFSVQPL